MPFVKVWIHFVWSTKNREPILSDEIRTVLFPHIKKNARYKNIHIDFINGYLEHVHCLISLGADQTIEKIMQLIKGESSFWINRNKLTRTRFEWQDEYFAVSVSESNLESVRRYIANQQIHHRKRSFRDEFDDFIVRGGFQKFKDVSD